MMRTETEPKPYGMWTEPHSGGRTLVICSCGWSKTHQREKVRLAAANRHTVKTGHKWIRNA